MAQQLENGLFDDTQADNPAPAGTPQDDAGPSYRTSRYTVYPTGYSRVGVSRRRDWRVFVEDDGDGWAVRWRNQCLTYNLSWEFEPTPKGRTPEFLHRTRFSERSALLRAKQAVDQLLVEGMTYDEFVESVHDEAAAAAQQFLEQHGTETLESMESRQGTPLWDRFRHAFAYKNSLD
jgi:hypothetical protein